jgi:nucleoside-diphosphate-sugar epimerase
MAEMSYFDDIRKVAELQLPWEKLDNRNILVAGATGLIGSCLVDVLMARPNRNYYVYAMGRNQRRMELLFGKYQSDEGFHTIIGDVTNPLSIQLSIHYIIHAASGAAPSDFSSHPVEVMKANMNGVINLMEYGLQHQMKRFLYVSSGEVYGEGDGRVFTEDYSGYVNCNTSRSCYPSSKRAAETLCASYAAEYGAEVVIARPCHVYGPNFTETDNRVYAQFIRNILKGEDIVMKSSGEQFRSWCYVVDCVLALLFILLKGSSGEAYNIADPASVLTIKQLAEMLAAIGNCKVVMEVPSKQEKKGYNPVSKSVFSIDKLECLGWSATGTMKEKMTTTVNFLKMSGR